MIFKNNKCIKRTGHKPYFKYWYWNIKENRLITKFGKPKKNLFYPHYIHHPDDKRRFNKPAEVPLQIADIIYYWKKNVFGIVIKHIGKKSLLIKSRNSKIFRCRRSSLYLLDSNTKIQVPQIGGNLMLAQTQSEIDFAETIIGTDAAINYLLKNDNFKKHKLNESFFNLIHKLMFKHLYPWAGKYRTEDLYVGKFNSKTLSHKKIKSSMKSAFDMLNNKITEESPFSLEGMANLLTSFHKELAWIHPFHDGNGRAIRWFCTILSYRLGFLLDLKFESPSRKKKHYHQAVRKAIENRNSIYLKRIFLKGLSRKEAN